MRSHAVSRTLSAGALGAALVFAAAGAAGAADLAEPKVTTFGGKQVIKVHAEETGAQFVPEGGEATDEFPDEETYEPKAGDAFTFTEDLTQTGLLVGTDTGTCTIQTDVDKTTCVATLTFPKGSIRVQETFSETEETEQESGFTASIVSGTGVYAGITGTLVGVDNEDESTDLTLTYTTGSGQVSEVPAGGANTGGGAPGASTTDTAVLIAVGLAAVAGGAGLFGAARVAARRD